MLGELKVTDINRGSVKDCLLDKVNNGFANSTASHMEDVISGVLNKAFDDELIKANPALRLGKNLLKARERKKHIRSLDMYYHWFPGKKKSEVDGLDDSSLMLPSAPYVHPEAKKESTVNG